MAKRKKKNTGHQRLVQILVILVFCTAAIIGGVKCFVRPPDLPPLQDAEAPSSSTGGETSDTTSGSEKDPETETGEQEVVEPQKPRFTPRPLCFNILVAGLDNDNRSASAPGRRHSPSA